jgi:hypothetical protein
MTVNPFNETKGGRGVCIHTKQCMRHPRGALVGAGARARSIERFDRPGSGPQEAVRHGASVQVGSSDLSSGVDAFRECALVGPYARACSIERLDRPATMLFQRHRRAPSGAGVRADLLSKVRGFW